MKALVLVSLLLGLVFTETVSAQQYMPGCEEILAISKVLAIGKEIKVLELTHGLRRRICIEGLAAGQPAYYDNGQLATNAVGTNGSTWYYATGAVFTTQSNTVGASWLFQNGRELTSNAYGAPSTYSYSDGLIITQGAGQEGAQCLGHHGEKRNVSLPSFRESGDFEINNFLEFILKNCF